MAQRRKSSGRAGGQFGADGKPNGQHRRTHHVALNPKQKTIVSPVGMRTAAKTITDAEPVSGGLAHHRKYGSGFVQPKTRSGSSFSRSVRRCTSAVTDRGHSTRTKLTHTADGGRRARTSRTAQDVRGFHGVRPTVVTSGMRHRADGDTSRRVSHGMATRAMMTIPITNGNGKLCSSYRTKRRQRAQRRRVAGYNRARCLQLVQRRFDLFTGSPRGSADVDLGVQARWLPGDGKVYTMASISQAFNDIWVAKRGGLSSGKEELHDEKR